MNSLLAAGDDATRSLLGELRQGGEIIVRSRSTYEHALNGPLGMCAEAILRAISAEKREEGTRIPAQFKLRLQELLGASGEGGDHVVAVCTTELSWLMFIDPAWTQEHLISKFSYDHPKVEAAWSGLVYEQQILSQQVRLELKPLLIKAYPWLESLAWPHEQQSVPAQWLTWMCVFATDQAYGITQKEMRNALRAMSENTRNHVIFCLGMIGQSNENGWRTLIIPFIEAVWPRERSYRTEASTQFWIRVLDDTQDDFPAVYLAIKKFLVPFDGIGVPFYRFSNGQGEQKPIACSHPEATLDLMSTVIPHSLNRLPYELPKILALIAETRSDLIADLRYVRLMDLVERG